MYQRCLGELTRNYGPLKRCVPMVLFRNGNHCTLNLLSLVSGMLRIASPRCFDERDWATDHMGGAVALDYEIKVVRVAILIDPRHLLARPCRRSRALLVEVQSSLCTKSRQLRLH